MKEAEKVGSPIICGSDEGTPSIEDSPTFQTVFIMEDETFKELWRSVNPKIA